LTPRRGDAGRGPGALRDEAPAPSGTVIAALLLGALVLRLVIAYVLFPHSGFRVDIGSFASWGATLARYGPGGFYTNAGFADYTPGYLYVLWLYEGASQWVGQFTGDAPLWLAGEHKLPAILFDLALGYLIYRAVRSWSGERAGLIGAALYLFNPVTWYESALWGQVDAVGTFVLLGAVLLLVAGWSEAAAGTAVLAALVKPQYAIVLFVVGFVLLGRHLLHPGSGPVPRPRHPLAIRLNEALGGWFVAEQGPWRLVSSAAVGLAVLFLVITPFDLAELAALRAPLLPIGGDLGGLLVVVGQAAGQYHYLTVNAHNLWALVGPTPLAWAGVWTSDLLPAIGAIPYVAIGAFLLAVTLTFLAYQLLVRHDRASIVVTATVLAVAFFVVPTRVHERYLFPAFALGALLAGGSVRWRWWYVALALANAANLHANLTNPLYGTANVVGLPLGALFRSGDVVALIAVTHTALFLWALWHVRPALDHVLDLLPGRREVPMVWRTPWAPLPDGAEHAATAQTAELAPETPETTAAVPAEAAAEPAAPGAPGGPPGDAAPAGAPGTAEGPPIEPPWEATRLEPPSWLVALRRRVTLPSIRPDRSLLLNGEGPGRIDRLDLLALAMILVLGLTLRAFRADQPLAMVTLDEVYHARTATEFLQDWRYGMPHAIYEYTHPHLAKYLMAAGVVVLGDDRVVGTSELGAPVRSAALERRYAPFDRPGQRGGDRLFVATGETVRVIDLRTGADEARIPVLATAVAVDEGAHRVYIGAASGVMWSLETSTLDRWRDVGGDAQEIQPVEVARVDGPIDRLWALAPDRVVARSGDEVIAIDPTSGALLGRRSLRGLTAAVPLASVPTVVAHPESITDLAGEARTLAELLALDAEVIEGRLRAPAPDPDVGVRIHSYVSSDQRAAVEGAIEGGQLAGTEVLDRVPLAAAVSTGVAVLDGTSLDSIAEVSFAGAATGLDRVGEGNERKLYVAGEDRQLHIVRLPTDGVPVRAESLPMPGPVSDVRWNPATNLVHVLGEAPSGGPTIYVVEPHGNAVFGDAALPFSPVAWVLDVQPDRPAADRERALVLDADGSTAAVEIGQNAFAWRFPGIVLGVLMAAAVYLLARFLFRRRAVALLATAAVLTDGMLFAHSRDAMNDAYVGFFAVAALTVLAWLWMPAAGRRSGLALALGLPLVGVLLGLGLASKWAAAFAIGAAILLILLRSALGRLVALAGTVVLAGLLGNLALATGNITFALLLLGLALVMAAAFAWRPMVFSSDEVRYAALAPCALGMVLLLTIAAGVAPAVSLTVAGTELPLVMVAAGGFLMTGVVAWFALRVAAAIGWIAVTDGSARGVVGLPPVTSRDPDDAPSPPPVGWLRPGAARGIPFTYALFCVAVVPLVVYVLSYVPWARPWDQTCVPPANDCPQIIPATVGPDGTTLAEGWPAGHRGQTLFALTIGMYDYHNDLRATHPASSPWWAWPFDLKPVWLFQDSHGAGTTAVVFDAGNLVTFWLSVPAIGFGLWQAWRRRSLALGFVAIAFLAQWLAWARIDRVTFQYHYYTALPFAFVFLGYFLAELWHGPSRLTWVLARVAAAVAIIAPGLLWLMKDPLCVLAGVQTVNPGSYLCTGASGSLVIPIALVVTALILMVGLALLAREVLRLGTGGPLGWGGGGGAAGAAGTTVPLGALGRLTAIAVATGILATVVPRLIGSGTFTFTGSVSQAWVVGVVYVVGAAAFAWLALGARDPRRYVAVVLGAAVAWFVTFYPYVADLPLPSGAPYAYQRLLPTFDYSFQFAVNQAPSPKAGLFDPQGLVLVASIAIAVIVGMLLVRQWRIDRLAMAHEDADGRQPAGT